MESRSEDKQENQAPLKNELILPSEQIWGIEGRHPSRTFWEGRSFKRLIATVDSSPWGGSTQIPPALVVSTLEPQPWPPLPHATPFKYEILLDERHSQDPRHQLVWLSLLAWLWSTDPAKCQIWTSSGPALGN